MIKSVGWVIHLHTSLTTYLDRLAELVNGDARMSLNYLELLYDMAEDNAQGEKEITLKLLSGSRRGEGLSLR